MRIKNTALSTNAKTLSEIPETSKPLQFLRTQSLGPFLVCRKLAGLEVSQPFGKLCRQSLDDLGVVGGNIVVVDAILDVVVELVL